ncbi:MAG: UDP-2,4-diacetamido-2,4,6-trideoxy-beta-L-altropyranose hydrolase [Sterolibacteriaceae bacterium MAG5]|nr:UDP-2,4-diacetamido-2,4,6-trideoxy-beta-L-altropyranose hydrolase [Candidatus Nitricoxidireducens bremensis]
MRVAIRADASTWIGSGHVVRCTTLARELLRLGAEVVFICREMPGDRCDWLAKQGFSVLRLSPVTKCLEVASGRGYEGWLGLSIGEDASEVVAALATYGSQFDWLVVDHYALDMAWEKILRPSCRSILAIDDLADRQHECDLLLDQNLVGDGNDRYLGKVPPVCKQMLGPRFALLQPDYVHWRKEIKPRTGPVRQLFVYFGDADLANLTLQALKALETINSADLSVDVAIGLSNPHREELTEYAAKSSNVVLHIGLRSLAPLMAKADLALGAAGTAVWERCCLGLPSLVVTVADNQIPIARELHRRRLARWLGNADDVDVMAIARALSGALNGEMAGVSSRCMELVDGWGAQRVSEIIFAAQTLPWQLCKAGFVDEDLLLRWANDLDVRRNSFCPDPIDHAAHHAWLAARLEKGSNTRIYIAKSACDTPIGQVRFERKDGLWVISFSIDALFRGAGLAPRLLSDAMRELMEEMGPVEFVGRVKTANPKSINVFERLGFMAHIDGDTITFTYSSVGRPLEAWKAS